MKAARVMFAVFLVLLVPLLLPSVSLAGQLPWTTPIPTPPQYGNRVYGYEQATRYWINENGYQLGTSGADLVGRMWSSVFAVPGGPMDTGYTAVTNLDSSTNDINGDSQEYQTVLQDFLEALNIPYDSTTSSWLVSPAYNQATYGTGSAFSQKSGLDFDVPLSLWVNPSSGTSTPSGVTLTPPTGGPGGGYTIGGSASQQPYPLYVGAAADVGAGYQPDGSVAYWEAYGGPDEWGIPDNGIANMTQQEAVTLYDTFDLGYTQSGVEQGGATTGNVIVSYPFTSELEAIDYASGTVTATALNPTPYDIIGENWYAYIVKPDQYGDYTGTATLLTQGTVSIGAQPLGNTTPNQSQFTFSVPASDAGDELIVTLNETLNSDQSVTPEGLPVYYAWGPNSNTQTPADNSPKDQVVPLNIWNVTSQGTAFDPSGTPAAYADNAMYLLLPGSSGGSGTQPSLVVQPATATVSVGGTQQYEAIYHDGQNGGNGQVVTQTASWYSGNTGIATVIVSGSNGGLATGVAQGVTGISATYQGLTASGQINVTAGGGYNLKALSVDTGADNGAQPGQTYQATAKFASTFPTSGTVEIYFYEQVNGGTMTLLGNQQLTMPANGTLTSNPQSWQFPSGGSGTTTVTITASIDYYESANGTNLDTVQKFNGTQWESDTAPPNPSGNPSIGSDPDNSVQASVSYQPNTVSVNGDWAAGYATIPLQVTKQEWVTKSYSVTPMGKVLPIVPGPTQTWGPPHFYLSY